MKRGTLNGWFRKAVAQRGSVVMAEKDDGSASGSAELRQALGIITNRKSISPQAVRNNAQSPAATYSDSSAATKVQLANTLSAALSALSTTTSFPHTYENTQDTKSAAADFVTSDERRKSAAGHLAEDDVGRGPLDTLQRLKNVYRPANNSFMSSSDVMPQESFPAGSSRQLTAVDGALSQGDAGPLAWFLQVDFSPAPFLLLSCELLSKADAECRGNLQQYGTKDAASSEPLLDNHAAGGSDSRRFQKLNGLEAGSRAMLNPSHNIIVEAGTCHFGAEVLG